MAKLNIGTGSAANVAHEIEVTRVATFPREGGGINVVFDVKINSVIIYGCRIIDGKNGSFVSFPSHKGKDGKYYSHAYVKLSETETQLICDMIAEQMQ